MRRLPATRLSIVAVGMLVAACGSTVQLTSHSSLGPGGTSTAQSPGANGLGGPATVGLSPGGGPAVRQQTARGVTPTTSGRLPDASGGTQLPGASSAPGVTDTTLTVGIPLPTETGAANYAAGAQNIDPGDRQADWDALIAWVNKAGGIGGRRVVPIYYTYASTTQTSEQVESAACAKFTQDHHVFAVLSVADANFASCILKSGAVMVGEDYTPNGGTFFRRFPYYFEPGDLNLDRIVANEIPQLVAQNYFGKAPKIGVVTYDDPEFAHAVDKVLLPSLKRFGLPAPEIVRLPEPQSGSDLGREAAAVSNAVLKFHADGVDHVLFVQVSAYPDLLFMRDAESQQYRPRYGFNSQDSPNVLVQSGTVPAAQLVGAAGIGWSPITDLVSDPARGPYSNSVRRRCDAAMDAAGIAHDSADADLVVNLYCDDILFLKAVLERTGRTITRPGFLAAANALGSSYVSPVGLGANFFDSTHHDGVSLAYGYSYQASCTCMAYIGRPFHLT